MVACVQSVVLPARRDRERRPDRERRRRRARPARAVDPDCVRLRRTRGAARAALRHRRSGPGLLPAAVRDRVPQLLEPARAISSRCRWFHEVATYNPVSYLIEGVRSLIITGWDGQALALAFGFALAAERAHAEPRRRGDEEPAGEDVRRFFYVTRGVAWRSIHNTLVSPAILLPSIIFPLFFLAAFAGGLVADRRHPQLRLQARLHGIPVRVRVPAVGRVRRRLHGLRDRARLRRRLRAPAAADRASAQRHHRRLRGRRAPALVCSPARSSRSPRCSRA